MFTSIMGRGFGGIGGFGGQAEDSEEEEEEEEEDEEIPGGFKVNDTVTLCSTLSLQGQMVGKKGDEAIVVGPSKNYDRVRIKLKCPLDGITTNITVRPEKIIAAPVTASAHASDLGSG